MPLRMSFQFTPLVVTCNKTRNTAACDTLGNWKTGFLAYKCFGWRIKMLEVKGSTDVILNNFYGVNI